MKFLFPAMFLTIWQLLKDKVHLIRDFSKLAIGIPRGFAKTTVVKFWTIYCILFTKRKFILIISHTEKHAINIIKDVCDMLSSQSIIGLFGTWNQNSSRDTQECKVFHFRGRQVTLAGVGATGAVRGLNVGNARPDVMIFEDYQSKKDSENIELSNSLYAEMNGTHMKSKANDGCLFIFVANMYPTPGSILKKLKNNPDWISFIVGGILADGTSLWEELQPLEQLLAEFQADINASVPEVFLSEVLNDETAGIKAGIDITKLPRNPFTEDSEAQGRCIIIDPALDNPSSDYNGVLRMGLYDGIPVAEEIDLGKYNAGQLIKHAILMALRSRTKLILVENVAYQASLLYWFNFICELNSIKGLIFLPLNIGGRSKNAKIIGGLRSLVDKKLFVSDLVWPFFISELLKFDPKKKNNSDTTLDLVQLMEKALIDHGTIMCEPFSILVDDRSANSPRQELENCEF